jgi:hypothetical protein
LADRKVAIPALWSLFYVKYAFLVGKVNTSNYIFTIYTSGNTRVTGSVQSGDYVSVVNGVRFGDGYPCLSRNVISGDYVLEVIMPNGTQAAADMVVTVNLTVGQISGGLSVTGIIGLSGDLSGNCYIQYGSGTGALQLAKTDTGVISIQNWNGNTWNLATLTVSNLFCDHLNGASGDGVTLFDHLVRL